MIAVSAREKAKDNLIDEEHFADIMLVTVHLTPVIYLIYASH